MQIRINSAVSFSVLALLCFLSVRSSAAIRYVKPGSTGTAPFTSWATASNDLQAVINQCVAGDDIWVAAGTYIPNRRADATGTITLNDRDNAFVLKSGVRIFGGFNGTETVTSQRNFSVNICILSGDLGVAGSFTDNCYHVVVCAGAVTGTALNGFYVRFANANGSGTITVNAVSVGRGSGGGIRINSASPVITNCVFSANRSGNNGGGMVCDNASPAITNCLFHGNTANDGAGMFNTNASSPEITNCTFSGNGAGATGGAMRNGNSSSPIISNCIIWANLVGVTPDAIYNADAGSVPAVNYSLVQGGYAGTGNMNADPLFVNPLNAFLAPTVAGDYRLQNCSPCINAGQNTYVPGSVNNDLDYLPRINYGIVDMGAYEKQLQLAVPDANGIVYVDSAKNGNGSSWVNAVKELADALAAARFNSSIKQLWVAKGTYYPKYPFGTNINYCGAVNSNCTFTLPDSIKVFGGFSGVETDTAGRNIALYPTILNGNIGNPLLQTDNCQSVIVNIDNPFAYINGLTVTEGYGSLGALLFNNNNSKMYVRNCVFTKGISTADGGAIGNINSQLFVGDCIFHQNAAGDQGGSIYSNATIRVVRSRFTEGTGQNGGAIHVTDLSGQSILDNSVFLGNQTTNFGGAVCSHSHITANNCLIAGNKSNLGAAIHFEGGNYTLSGCTIASNTATLQGSVYYNTSTSPDFTNCIIYGNSTLVSLFAGVPPNITYSTVQGGFAGAGNTSADPLFISQQPSTAAPTTLGDYRLQRCSPAVNAGNNSLVPSGVTRDLDSNVRISLGTVDMGAYEKHLARPDAGGIVYVDSSNIAVSGDGSSWEKAVTQLADALKEAKSNTDVKEIWVAKGTYKPLYKADDGFLNSICHSTDREASFVLVPDLKIYAGFAGGETSLSQRNHISNPVILSGDIGLPNDTSDNCQHVLIGSNPVGDCLVDGVIIEKGKSYEHNSVNIVNGNGIFRESGAGICLYNSAPLFRNCTIRFNHSYSSGAGVYINGSLLPVFNNCTITANKTILNGAAGAGAYMDNNSGAHFYGCLITGNYGGYGAGLHYRFSATPGMIRNCTVAGNKVNIATPSDVYTYSALDIKNSIISSYLSNPANISDITYSCLSSAHPGTGNIHLDPLFVAPGPPAPSSAGDYRLQACSPAINMGDNAAIPPGLSKDIDSSDRVKYSTVDMGAYEKQTIDLANTSWKGINTNWNDKINWCGGFIPADTTNVTVPVTSNNPSVNAGYQNQVKNILLANNTSIAIAHTGKLTINGTYTNSGSTISNNGDWVMAGNAIHQTFPGLLATVSAMNNLEINNSSGLKFDKSFQLTGTLTLTDGNINVDNATVTLHSDASSTARVAAIPSGVSLSYTGNGRFEVERYIPPHRAWRLLTAPLSTATNLTISQAWQEGVSNANRLSPVDPAPGFGTIITRSTTYNAADGYDQGSTNNPSIRYFNGTHWGGVPTQTNGTTPGANNGLINDQQGYMLFVRGNRAIQVAGTGVAANVATLRPKGQLKVGTQTIVCNGWTVIGNPYASPINFHKIVLDNPGLPDVFYVWDANLAGSYNVGGWVSYGAYDGGSQTYTVTPQLPGSTFANNRGDIASGTAFMVNYTGNISISENHKSTLGDNVLFRPVRQLGINLYVVNADSSLSLNDGLVINMGRLQHTASAEKNTNFTENLAVLSEGKRYAIQNSPGLQFNDSICIYAGQLKQRSYVLEMKADELELPPGMKAWLEDAYLRRYLKVSLNGSTHYAFTVSADTASSASGRFRLLFRKSPRFVHVMAAGKGPGILLKWQMEEVFGVQRYEIERSVNGTGFITVGRPPESRDVYASRHGQWLDPAPGSGIYYYRIKAISMDGDIYYSDVVQADNGVTKKGIYVYPNPVTGNCMQLRLNEQSPGVYQVRLISSAGQILLAQPFICYGGYESIRIDLPGQPAAGSCQLEVIKPGGIKEVMEVLLQR